VAIQPVANAARIVTGSAAVGPVARILNHAEQPVEPPRIGPARGLPA